MSLASRITGGFLILVVLVGGLAAYHLSLIGRLHAANRQLARVDLEASRTTLRIWRETAQLARYTRVLFVRRDAGYVARLEALRAGVDGEIERLGELRLSGPERDEFEGLATRWRDYRAMADELEPKALTGGERPEAEGGLLQALAAVESELERLDAASQQSTVLQIEASAADAARAWAAAWVGTVAALAGGLALAMRISGSVARPLARLGRGTREMTEGHFAFRVPVAGAPELASLARDFNAMADRLGELDELKKEFVSTVSHDLKAPLASMLETTRLLLDGSPGPLNEKQQRLLRLDLQCGERLGAMIEDLLEVARLEAGKVDLALEPVDLCELCRQALAEAQGLLQARDHPVEAQLPNPGVGVAADRTLLLRALWNLLSNAAKFSRPGTRIGVRIRSFSSLPELTAAFERWPGGTAPPAVSVEVQDSGPGIPDAQKERIFDRFHRADAKRRGEQGSGLGLAIARMIVAGHRGELWVEDPPGGGSRFVMLLPSRP